MATNIIWEQMSQEHSGTIWRSKVPGGWLVKTVENEIIPASCKPGKCTTETYKLYPALCFVPDPTHEWEKELIVWEFNAWLAELTVQTKKCFPDHTPNAAFMKANYYDKRMSPNAAAYEYIAKAQFTS